MVLIRTVKCQRLAGGHFTAATASVIIEKELPVYINGRHLFTASLTPTMEKEFVAGYLFGQGLIDGMPDIASLEIRGGVARLALKADKPAALARPSFRIVSGGGKIAYFAASSLRRLKSELVINKADIFKGMNAVLEKAALYRETEGVHAAGIFHADASPICIVEDIGRHNTLDKVIGFGLLNNIDFGRVFLASTGRLTSEMVIKVCRSGIPLVATKTAVTDKGLAIGKRCGMAVIGFVKDVGTQTHTDMEIRVSRKAAMKIYCGAERVR